MANLLCILTGSIACYKACDAISRLVQRGHAVRAVATGAALRFVGPATLEGLTGQKVAHDLFAEGEALDHIALTRWADLVLVCPATANTLNRMAAGLGEDLAGALLLAHDWKKPLLVAPAMNPAMWTHPATVGSVQRLQSWGARFVPVGEGRTACGEVGEGRLAEPAAIVAMVEAALVRPARRLRVLVTSGGTAEPVDAVRVLTNTSTGGTGALVAEHFARGGHDVVLLRAANARSSAGVREEVFTTFADLDRQLTHLLAAREFDGIIHAAAVSDFSVAAVEVDGVRHAAASGKLASGSAPVLRLQCNPKLLPTLRERSRRRDIRVVGFKLTRGADPEQARDAVMSLVRGGAVDFVVHNDLAAREAQGAFPAEIWSATGERVAHCADRNGIGPALEKLLLAADKSQAGKESERPQTANPELSRSNSVAREFRE